jgi:Holliday junction resolvase RusA-like endonuclease
VSDRFDMFVPGRPVPQGSKRALMPKGGKVPVVIDANPEGLAAWRRKVTNEAIEKQAEYMHTQPGMLFPIGDPIGLTVTFAMERPRFHYGTGKNADIVKESAPKFPAIMPDIDKLLRAILDALTDAQVWRDDGQVVWVLAKKVYDAGRPGVAISLGRMK